MNIKKIFLIFTLFLIGAYLITPSLVSARTLFYIWERTTCAPGQGGPTAPCGLCDALVVGRNIIEDMFKVAFILVVIFIAYGGLMIMTAGGNEKTVTNAKGIITSAVYGLLIALCAWLVINTIFNSLIGGGVTVPWNEISCVDSQNNNSTGNVGGGNNSAGNNGSTQGEIHQLITSSCEQQVSACVKETKVGSNENPQLNIKLEAAYQISCKKIGTGYNAQLQFKCLTPVISPWKKCSDWLPDLSMVCS
jgi:hypothetical protein